MTDSQTLADHQAKYAYLQDTYWLSDSLPISSMFSSCLEESTTEDMSKPYEYNYILKEEL